eukprot:gene15008-16557_t
MADDVLDSWEDATDLGEFEKRMEKREQDILKREEMQKQAAPGAIKYSGIAVQEESGRSEYTPQIKILKRANGPAQQKNQQKTVKPIRTLAEKEADYAAARARILGDFSNTNPDEETKRILASSDLTTPNGRHSSPSAGSNLSRVNETLVDHILEGSSLSGIGELDLKRGVAVKRNAYATSSLDYVRERDMDVEGVEDYVMWHENFRNEAPLPVIPRQQKCSKPVLNVAFLKTHYTGSDVLTNIFNRLGDLRSLNMALPSDGLSTFYWPMRFQWKYIDITLLNGSLPNIICNHARYNGDVMDNIMTPGTVYITMLRNPVTQLETTFHNLKFAELLEIGEVEDTLKTFISNPKVYIQNVIKRKKFKDSLNLIKNAMFFDLGLSTTEYHKANIIKATITEIYEKFSVVLIYEYLDESLILLRRRLCLQIDDILYLKFHHTSQNAENREQFSPELAELIREWNSADAQLYAAFNETLWKEIGYEGASFWEELREFKTRLREIEQDCVLEDSEFGRGFEEVGGSGSLLYNDDVFAVQEHARRNPNNTKWNSYFCKKLFMTEVEYLHYFRKKETLSRGTKTQI